VRRHVDVSRTLHAGETGVAVVREELSHRVVEDHDRSTYRAVYTVRFGEVVYVLHAFQKKSTRGYATPEHDLNRIRERLKSAERHYGTHYAP
jgi:phage-related protein